MAIISRETYPLAEGHREMRRRNKEMANEHFPNLQKKFYTNYTVISV